MKKIYDENGNLFAELNYLKEYFLDYSKHSHKTFAIGIIGTGKIELDFHAQEKQYLSPNEIVIFNPNQVHQTNSKTKKSLDYYTLHVNLQWCKSVQSELYSNNDKFIDIKPNIINEKNIHDELIRIFEDICLNKSEYENKKLEEVLIYILKKYSKIDNANDRNECENILLDEVKRYILENINNPITLKDISLEVGYDESYITRVFKNEFGLTPHAFLINKRVEKARDKLLNDEHVNLAQLSNEVGFYDQSHFSKVFKRVFAITPNKYKNTDLQTENRTQDSE